MYIEDPVIVSTRGSVRHFWNIEATLSTLVQHFAMLTVLQTAGTWAQSGGKGGAGLRLLANQVNRSLDNKSWKLIKLLAVCVRQFREVEQSMEGCFAVEEDINFDNFLKSFVHDDDKVQKMIENSKQVWKMKLSLHQLNKIFQGYSHRKSRWHLDNKFWVENYNLPAK